MFYPVSFVDYAYLTSFCSFSFLRVFQAHPLLVLFSVCFHPDFLFLLPVVQYSPYFFISCIHCICLLLLSLCFIPCLSSTMLILLKLIALSTCLLLFSWRPRHPDFCRSRVLVNCKTRCVISTDRSLTRNRGIFGAERPNMDYL